MKVKSVIQDIKEKVIFRFGTKLVNLAESLFEQDTDINKKMELFQELFEVTTKEVLSFRNFIDRENKGKI